MKNFSNHSVIAILVINALAQCANLHAEGIPEGRDETLVCSNKDQRILMAKSQYEEESKRGPHVVYEILRAECREKFGQTSKPTMIDYGAGHQKLITHHRSVSHHGKTHPGFHIIHEGTRNHDARHKRYHQMYRNTVNRDVEPDYDNNTELYDTE